MTSMGVSSGLGNDSLAVTCPRFDRWNQGVVFSYCNETSLQDFSNHAKTEIKARLSS